MGRYLHGQFPGTRSTGGVGWVGGSQSTGARCDSDGEGGGEGILEPGGMGWVLVGSQL